MCGDYMNKNTPLSAIAGMDELSMDVRNLDRAKNTGAAHPNVFVRGIPLEWSEEDLVALFGNFGKLTSVRLVRHSTKKSSLGYGFVRYECVDDAAQAIEALGETMIGGQLMQVKLADADAGPPATSTVSGLTPCDGCYVKHVPSFYTKEHVTRLFGKYGGVVDVKMYPCLDAFRGSSALVKMDSIESASKAIDAIHGMKPDGSLHSLIVRFAESVAEKQARLARKDVQAVENSLAAVNMLAALSGSTVSSRENSGDLYQSGSQIGMHIPGPARGLPVDVHSTQGNVLQLGPPPIRVVTPELPTSDRVSMVSVTNLSPNVDRLWLYEQFAKYGPILLLTLDPQRRSAQIVYGSVTAALEAKNAYHDVIIHDHRLCVTASLL